jgi:hypothetical protein
MMVHLCPAGSEGASYRYVHIRGRHVCMYSAFKEPNEHLVSPVSG